MKIWKVLFTVGCGLLVAACGGGGGGGSSDTAYVTPADFSGNWSGNSNGTSLKYTITQTGSDFNMTRTEPVLAGITYTGSVNGNSALVKTYINNALMATSTLTLSNDTTASMTVDTCTPPQGYSCAPPGSTLTVTRDGSPIQTFPLDAAYTKVMASGHIFSGTAIDGADTYSISLSVTPAADKVFEGALRKRSVELLTMKKNNAIIGTEELSLFYSISPFLTKGATYSDGSYAVQTTNMGSLPTTAKVGDSGSLGTLTLYTDASRSTVKATTQSTWTIEADSTNTAFGCANSVISDAAGRQTGTTAGCYKIDTNGNVLGMRYTLNSAGKTLIFVGPVVSIPTFPLDAAYTKAMTSGVNLSGTAIDGADTYTMSMYITPAADEFFEGAASKKAIETLTMKKNGAVVVTDTMSLYFSINPMTTKGALYSNGSYAVQTSTLGGFPTAAKVGDSGSLGTVTQYSNSSKATVLSTTQSTWTMEADTASTAFGCANSVLRDASGAQMGTTAGCYKIDTSGNVLGMRYTITAPGKTLVFN